MGIKVKNKLYKLIRYLLSALLVLETLHTHLQRTEFVVVCRLFVAFLPSLSIRTIGLIKLHFVNSRQQEQDSGDNEVYGDVDSDEEEE